MVGDTPSPTTEHAGAGVRGDDVKAGTSGEQIQTLVVLNCKYIHYNGQQMKQVMRMDQNRVF